MSACGLAIKFRDRTEMCTIIRICLEEFFQLSVNYSVLYVCSKLIIIIIIESKI